MAEQILVDPQDRVAGAQLRWSGAELHLVDDDAMHPRRRRRGDEQGDGGYRGRTGYRAHHRRLAARCSACIWCWLNSVSPVSSSDFSSLFVARSEEHTSELQSLMRNSYAVFCLKKKKTLYIIH